MITLAELQPSVYGTSPAMPNVDDVLALYPPGHQQNGRADDSSGFVRVVSSDHQFASAVKAGDVQGAAQACFRIVQQHGSSLLRLDDHAHVWEDIMQQGAQHWQQQVPALPWHRELRTGDWVVIQSYKKASDAELVGKHGSVQTVEENGMVTLQLEHSHHTVRLHQRHLSVVSHHTGHGHHHRNGHGGYRRTPGHVTTGGGTTGDISTDTDDGDRARGPRVVNLGQPLLPARVGPLLGRGVCKAREVVKLVRKEVLLLEEVVPWDCVDAGWRNKRATWQRTLKSVDHTKNIDTVVPVIASCLYELHEALGTDKSGKGVTPILAKGGAWETRLLELSNGGNSYQCLQQLWDEMHEAVRVWLQSQGRPLPYPSPAQLAPPPPPFQGSAPSAHGHTKIGASGSRGFAAGSFSDALKAVTALQEGVCSTDRYLTVGQVAVERVLLLGREAFYQVMHLLRSWEELSLNTHLEALAATHDVAQIIGVTTGEMEKLSDADVIVLMLTCATVRSVLRASHTLDSEVDTDIDAGSDVTEMDLEM